MNVTRITGTAISILLLGLAMPTYAQHGQQDKNGQGKSQEQHAQKQRQSKQRQPHAQQQMRSAQNQHTQRAQQQKQSAQRIRQPQRAPQQRGNVQPQRAQKQNRVQQGAWQQHRARSWASDHRTWQQRGGYSGYRIPDSRFRGYFGPEHGFRIYGRPFMVVGGYPRFQYGGYWISLVDPWPEYWANDWYETDDVYVNYVDNGYYLFDRRHPTIGIAIRISM